jgi:hypothetical protein
VVGGILLRPPDSLRTQVDRAVYLAQEVGGDTQAAQGHRPGPLIALTLCNRQRLVFLCNGALDIAREQPGPGGKGQQSGPLGVVLRKRFGQGLHLLERVTGSTAGQHGLGQRDPQRLLDGCRNTTYQHLACPGLGVGQPARPGKQGN